MTAYERFTQEDKEAYWQAWQRDVKAGRLAFRAICRKYGLDPDNFKNVRRRLDDEFQNAHRYDDPLMDSRHMLDDEVQEGPWGPEPKPPDEESEFVRLEREYHEKVYEARQRQATERAESELRIIVGERRAIASGRSKQREIAVLTLSDLHWSKVTATFNEDIARKRMEIVGNKLANIRDQIAASVDIEKLVILGLGDLIDGSGVYPTQAHHQENTNAEEQSFQCADFLADWTLAQRDVWGAVEWECVPGNHGRDGKFAHEHQNWDVSLYRHLMSSLKREGVPVRWNTTGSMFLRKIPLYGHQLLMAHGHQFKAHMSIPWYGLATRLARWSTGSYAPFDLFACGHHHSYGMWQINRILALMSGTMATDDTWAREELGYDSSTRWHLFGVSPTRPFTFHYGIELSGYGVDEQMVA